MDRRRCDAAFRLRAVRLSGCGRGNAGAVRTLLTPFDRFGPRHGALGSTSSATGDGCWQVSLLLRGTGRFGSLSTAAGGGIRLLPFQIEPALAMLRHARLRLLIADEVGLGKTIQTGMFFGSS